jgi:hypothetical protein
LSTKLNISPDLSLPLDFVVATDGIFATKGMGKSHLAQVMAEEMLEHGQVVVAIDPTDAWYGLRSSADGKHDGYPVTVFGGEHGDLKLEPDAAVDIAEAIVAERFSCVICTDGLSDTVELKFVRQFLDTIFRRNREPLHIFIDEADIFAPQKPFEVEDSRCIRAMSHIVRRGRKKGIGSTVITQRPAELNASVRSQVEMLFVLGMLNNLDIDAVEKWLRLRKKKKGDNVSFALQEEMIDSLDSLQQGDAWLWAPRQKLHKRFRARAKRTFDSGATPKPGQKVRVAKRLAPVDIARLGEKIAAAAARQKAEDPKALRARIAELEKQAAKGKPAIATAATTKVETKVVEKPVFTPAELKRLEQLAQKMGATQDRVEKTTADAIAKIEAIAGTLDDQFDGVVDILRQVDRRLAAAAPAPTPKARPIATPAAKVARPASEPTGDGERRLEPRHAKILTAIAWWQALGVDAPDVGGVAFVAGYSPTSSSFEKARGALRVGGYIHYPAPGKVSLTTEGSAATPPVDRPASTGELHAAVLEQLEPRHRKLLEPLIDQHPAAMTMDALAAAADYSATSSSFEKARGKLRSLGLVEYPKPGQVRATDLLFPGGVA